MDLDIAVRRPPEVRVSKILAGQEADKTNLLLQALAEAINLDVNNNDIVRKTLQSLGDTQENEEPSRSRDEKDQEQSERRRTKEERSSKSHQREELTTEKKAGLKDSSKVKSILRNEIILCFSSSARRIIVMETEVVIQKGDEALE